MEDVEFLLGDKRLNKRARFCLERIMDDPGESFPKLFRQSAELQGIYRFLHNENVDLEDLMAGTFANTQESLSKVDECVAIHDTTEFILESLGGRIAEFREDRGFLMHLTLMASAGTAARVYGAGGALFFSRKGKSFGLKNEATRWLEQSLEVEERFPGTKIIHLMDREGDTSENWSSLSKQDLRFVIRLKYNRKVRSEDGEFRLLRSEIQKAPIVAERQIELSKRAKVKLPKQAKRYQERSRGQARVEIRASRIALTQTKRFPGGSTHAITDTVALNVIYVREVGNQRNPIDWLLVTSEPINNETEVFRAIDLYRRRWLIEEFFKGLKTGCAIEARQLKDAGAWFRIIPFYLLACARILNLRVCEALPIDLESTHPWLSREQLKILIHLGSKGRRKVKTYTDIKMELAHLGGHLPRNGPPGWLTLLRGYLDLISLEKGLELARELGKM